VSIIISGKPKGRHNMIRIANKPRMILTLAATASLLLGGCMEGVGTKEGVGTIAGAALGGWGGSQIGSGEGRGIAIAAGVLLGGFLGNNIGKGLDKADRLEATRAGYRAFEYNKSGQASSWSNPDSGNSGTVTPRPAYQANNGQYCREYNQSINVGGKRETAVGTACRQSDGTWKVAG
jgi:surface antigen